MAAFPCSVSQGCGGARSACINDSKATRQAPPESLRGTLGSPSGQKKMFNRVVGLGSFLPTDGIRSHRERNSVAKRKTEAEEGKEEGKRRRTRKNTIRW
jgi:hypothetical protein